MGSSLVVFPFRLLVGKAVFHLKNEFCPDNVEATTPRVLINKEWAQGGCGTHDSGFQDGEDNIRDVFYKGDCDDGVTELVSLLGMIYFQFFLSS